MSVQSRRTFLERSVAAACLGLMTGCGLQAPRQLTSRAPKKVPRIGYFMAAPFDDPLVASLRDAFQEGLRALGYTQGESVDVVERWATGAPEAYDKVAADLLDLGVDIIVASGGPAIVAAKQATQTIPIVVTASADIAKTGLVSSLARPGGNITGLSFMAPDLAAKRLQLLTEAIPGLTRVSTIWNPAERANVVELEQVQIAAQSLRVDLQSIEAASLDRLTDAFAAAQGPHSGLMLFSHVFVINNRSRFIEMASQHRLPTIYGFKQFVADGGLMSYGPDLHDLYRRAPTYVDKILKGANPAELPIEQPTEFELVVNLKTAQALGATIPQAVIGQASEVVQ